MPAGPAQAVPEEAPAAEALLSGGTLPDRQHGRPPREAAGRQGAAQGRVRSTSEDSAQTDAEDRTSILQGTL